MLQEPEFHRAKKRGDLMITQKTDVHTSIHKVYKEKWLYRLLKAKITPISTYSQPYIHKFPSYRSIPTQNSSYPANPTNKTHFSTAKHIPNLPNHRRIGGGRWSSEGNGQEKGDLIGKVAIS